MKNSDNSEEENMKEFIIEMEDGGVMEGEL